MTQSQINNQKQKKQNNFGIIYGNGKKKNINTEWTNNVKKEWEELEKGLEGNIHLDS